ncbi:SDR family NAD(P)-dependent oxidoreductase [Streptomyces sp. L7]
MALHRPISCSRQWPYLRCHHRTTAARDKGLGIMGRLAGKIAFISGTGAGIGRAAAQIFAAEGARVFGCDIDEDSAAETVELVEKADGIMRSLAPVDLSTQDGAREWIEAGIAAFGGIDILYNNASALRYGPFETMPAEDWYFTIKNELDIPYFCTQAAWPHPDRPWWRGRSQRRLRGRRTRGAVHADGAPRSRQRWGVGDEHMHLCAAGAPHRIRVNTIAPGMTRTSATAPFPRRSGGSQGPVGGAYPGRADRAARGHRAGRRLPLLGRGGLRQRRQPHGRRRRQRDGGLSRRDRPTRPRGRSTYAT